MKRIFDLFLSLFLLILLAPLILFIMVAVKIIAPGPILYWSQRIGKNNKPFLMPKFRSMKVGTPILASHLIQNPDEHLISIGKILRSTSLDEIPQLWCILRGDMSFVGPRPALFNQYDLIEMRNQCGVQSLLPGLTGWAQINGRDELSNTEKVKYDKDYLENRSMRFDLRIMCMTIFKVTFRENISH